MNLYTGDQIKKAFTDFIDIEYKISRFDAERRALRNAYDELTKDTVEKRTYSLEELVEVNNAYRKIKTRETENEGDEIQINEIKAALIDLLKILKGGSLSLSINAPAGGGVKHHKQITFTLKDNRLYHN